MATRRFHVFLFLIVISVNWIKINCLQDDILRTCYDCELSERDLEQFDTVEARDKLYHFVTSGVGRIFYDSLNHIEEIGLKVNLSSECQHSLQLTKNGIRNREMWAYQCNYHKFV